jgi:hypothetical protein
MKKYYGKSVIVKALMTVSIGLLMTSCSSDSGVEESIKLDSNTIVFENDMIRVDYLLKNSAGQAVTTFKEGEDISFYLSITNKSNEKTEKILSGQVISEDIFTVYSVDGNNEVGKPWDGFSWGVPNTSTPTHDNYVYKCSWLGVNKVDENGRPLDIEYSTGNIGFFTTKPRTRLPKGKYYTEFLLNINDGTTITCHKDFSVIP